MSRWLIAAAYRVFPDACLPTKTPLPVDTVATLDERRRASGAASRSPPSGTAGSTPRPWCTATCRAAAGLAVSTSAARYPREHGRQGRGVGTALIEALGAKAVSEFDGAVASMERKVRQASPEIPTTADARSQTAVLC